MRRSLLIVSLVLVLTAIMALAGCQKTKIPPERYAGSGNSQSGAVTQPTTIQPPAEKSGGVKSSDLSESPAPGVASSQTPAPKPVAAPTAGSPAPQPQAGQVNPAREVVTYQIGAFSKPENAQALAQKVEALGFSTSVENDAAAGAPSHKVLATWRGSDAEGRARLNEVGVYDPILIGGRVDPRDQDNMQSMPAATSYVPEPAGALPATGVSYQVGAFAMEANAVQLKRQLEEDGFTVTLQNTPQDPDTKYRVVATWPGTDEEGRARLLEHDIFDPMIVQSGPQPAASTTTIPAASQAPAEPVAPAAPDASPQAEQHYTFQVGAFGAVENAEMLRDQLRGVGFETDVELVEEQGKPKYRVIARKQGSVPALRKELMDMGVANPILLGF